MFRIVTDLQGLVFQVVPPWAVPLVIGALVALAAPFWLENVRQKQIKGAVRRMVRADYEERPALVERALGLAGQRRIRLIALVQEAIRYDQRALRDEALGRLEQVKGGKTDAAELRKRVEKPRTRYRDPVEAAVRVEGLLDEGLLVAAREQLDEARSAFPDDPELDRLDQRLAAVTSGS